MLEEHLIVLQIVITGFTAVEFIVQIVLFNNLFLNFCGVSKLLCLIFQLLNYLHEVKLVIKILALLLMIINVLEVILIFIQSSINISFINKIVISVYTNLFFLIILYINYKYIYKEPRHKIKVSKIPDSQHLDLTCNICLETIDRSNIHQTNCKHMFHVKCIDEWLNNNDKNNCPSCRSDIP